jgi:PhnB protein
MSAEPKGVIPYILSRNGAEHVKWIEKVFAGEVKEVFHTDDTKTKIMHCKIQLNDGFVYLADDVDPQSEGDTEKEERENESKPGNMMGHLHITTEKEIDDLWKRALENDAKSKMDLAVQFWGDKYGMFEDPYGVQWAISIPAAEGPPAEKTKKTE